MAEDDLWLLAHGKDTDVLPLTMQNASGGALGSVFAAVRYLAREVYDLKHAGQGVELEVPAQPSVPYLDHN